MPENRKATMIAVITLIELKNPFKFFELSWLALKIVKQLKKSRFIDYKNTGFWTTHYTMTLWKDKEDMHDFARNGAHLDAMRKSAGLAKEIRTLVVEVSDLPKWKDARNILLKDGKSIFY